MRFTLHNASSVAFDLAIVIQIFRQTGVRGARWHTSPPRLRYPGTVGVENKWLHAADGKLEPLFHSWSQLGKNLALMATEPRPLYQSWPLYEKALHFGLGRIFNCAVTDVVEPGGLRIRPSLDPGIWTCDLADDFLTWSVGVYDIFGLTRGGRINRAEAAALYTADPAAEGDTLHHQ